MKLYTILFCIFIFSTHSFSQNLTGQELLEKAIAYHDPNNNWSHFNATLNITMETPNSSNRNSKIDINFPKEYFNLLSTRDSTTIQYTIKKEKCIISMNDSIRIANQTTKPKRTHCETTKLYKNYYTYLYGLPMKLKDVGTNIHDKVEYKTFKGKEYLVLKVTYNETVGSDTWYFYFNPKTYTMEIYQFFHDESKNDGEYILLTEEVTIDNIKMPKNRAWYTNKEDKLLGTDILKGK
jgi:hypothetical protein